MKSLGEIAYNAFRNSANNQSQSDWGYSDLHERVKQDWEASAKAVEIWATRNQQTCSCYDKPMFGMRGWDD